MHNSLKNKIMLVTGFIVTIGLLCGSRVAFAEEEQSDIKVSGTPYYFILDFDELKKSNIVQTKDDLKALRETMMRFQERNPNPGKPAITWLGIPSWQNSKQNWQMQEIIVEVKPDFIIETGTLYGGTTLFYADVLKNVNENGRVITIDINPQVEKASKFKTFRERVEVIKGSSISPDVIKEISKRIKDHHKVLVTLDSLHTKEHVLKELELYSKFVSIDSYIVVQDTWLYTEDPDDGPLGAVKEFLKTNKNFVKDYSKGRPFSMAYLYGILKRIK